MKYEVSVQEWLIRDVEIEAGSEDEALDKVRGMYRTEEIVLDSGDFDDVDFYISYQ